MKHTFFKTFPISFCTRSYLLCFHCVTFRVFSISHFAKTVLILEFEFTNSILFLSGYCLINLFSAKEGSAITDPGELWLANPFCNLYKAKSRLTSVINRNRYFFINNKSFSLNSLNFANSELSLYIYSSIKKFLCKL